MSKIFVSHSSKDEKLVNEFVDRILLLSMNIPQADVFCSSVAGHGVDSGEKIIEFIRNQLEKSSLTIFILSKNFYNSSFCLCEMGAAWFASAKVFFLIVPPLEYTDVKAVFSGRHVDTITDIKSYATLADIIDKTFGYRSSRVKFQETVKEFLGTVESNLATATPPEYVEYSKFKILEEELVEYKDEYSKSRKKIRELEIVIQELKELKGKQADAVLAKHTNAKEQFEVLVDRAKSCINNISGLLRGCLFDEFNERKFSFTKYDEIENAEQIKDAIDRRYILDRGDGAFEFIHDKKNIIDIFDALRELDKFLSEGKNADSKNKPFFDKFCNDKGYEASMSDKDFWEEYLL